MAEVTYCVALPFIATDDGIAAGEPTECFNPVAVMVRAEALSRKEGHVGAVAFSRTGDPATGDFSDGKVSLPRARRRMPRRRREEATTNVSRTRQDRRASPMTTRASL